MKSTEALIGRAREPVGDTWSYIPGKNDAEGAPGWGPTWACFSVFRDSYYPWAGFHFAQEELFVQMVFFCTLGNKNSYA